MVRKEPKKNTTQTKKRCPNGTRRDEKGNCVPKDQGEKKSVPNPSPKKTFKLVRKEPPKTSTQQSKKANKPDCTTRNPAHHAPMDMLKKLGQMDQFAATKTIQLVN